MIQWRSQFVLQLRNYAIYKQQKCNQYSTISFKYFCSEACKLDIVRHQFAFQAKRLHMEVGQQSRSLPLKCWSLSSGQFNMNSHHWQFTASSTWEILVFQSLSMVQLVAHSRIFSHVWTPWATWRKSGLMKIWESYNTIVISSKLNCIVSLCLTHLFDSYMSIFCVHHSDNCTS